MKKELIKQRFSKNLNTYQENALIQKNMAEKLIQLLPERKFDNILELGCGTGFLTKLVSEKISYNSYTAIDIVQECEPFIKKLDKNIKFLNTDIETLILTQKYDLIISNAVFQWLNDFEKFTQNIKNNLTDNGIFLFTTFGQKNFQEIANTSNISLNYYSIEDLKTILNDFKIEHLEEQIITKHFNSIKEMLEHMKKTGVNAISETTWTLKDIKDFKHRYQDIYGNNIQLTYNPIYVYLKSTNTLLPKGEGVTK